MQFQLIIILDMGIQCFFSFSLSLSLSSPYRFDECLQQDGPLLLTSDDPRVTRVARVTSRLITALECQEQHMVHGASWPPRVQRGELGRVIAEREKAGKGYQPSAVAKSGFMPFRPESGNPLKVLEDGDWNLYVVDLVSGGDGWMDGILGEEKKNKKRKKKEKEEKSQKTPRRVKRSSEVLIMMWLRGLDSQR